MKAELNSQIRLQNHESPQVDLIVAPYGFGGTDNLAQEGPYSLLHEKEIEKNLEAVGCKTRQIEPPSLGPFHIQEEENRIRNIDAINTVNEWVCEQLQTSLKEKHIPITLGGDGSLCIATLSGLVQALGKDKVGVIWISNHLCNSSPRVTKSWNANRMSFRVATFAENLDAPAINPDFKSIIRTTYKDAVPIIPQEQIVHLGINHKSARDTAEHLFFTMEDIDEQGARNTISKAIEALKDFEHIHIIWDVNSLDLSGVSNYSLGQLNYREALIIAREIDLHLRRQGRLTAIDIVEHCPSREAWDKRGETAEWITDILANIFGENIFNQARKY